MWAFFFEKLLCLDKVIVVGEMRLDDSHEKRTEQFDYNNLLVIDVCITWK